MKFIYGNWKLNGSECEVDSFVKAFKKIRKPSNVEFGLAVPFLYIEKMMKKLSKKCAIGAQNVCYAEKGAYTGEISSKMLADKRVNFSLVGHSERRTQFFETNEQINQKIKLLFNSGVMPLLCVGETKEEREQKKTKKVLKLQLTKALKDIPKGKKFIVAYEPVWAIGTGLTPEKAEIIENISYIKKVLTENINYPGISVLYGGSVKPENAKELLSSDVIDGALVGGASLNAEKFVNIAINLMKE